MAYRARKLTRPPVTAENIAIIQQQIETELSSQNGRPNVLNGRVKSSCAGSGSSGSVKDVKYEFQYVGNDTERSDNYMYSFKAFPVRKRDFESGRSNSRELDFESSISNLNLNDGVVGDEDDAKVPPRVQSAKLERKAAPVSAISRPKSATDGVSCTGSHHVTIYEGVGNSHDIKPIAGILKHRDGQIVTNLRNRKVSTVSKSSSHVHLRESGPARKVSTMSRASRISKQDDDCETSQRKISTMSGLSHHGTESQDNGRTSRQSVFEKRKSVCYDPVLEKATAFIHRSGKNFSQANTTLSGMQNLQMSYTETNLETNQSLIFLDLLKTSSMKSHIRGSQIRSIERRLEWKRKNPLYSTTFYEHKHVPDPYRRGVKKTARSAAQKKLERKEKIKQLSDEIHTGYVPTQFTMKIADRPEVVDIGRNCRYLRSRIPSPDIPEVSTPETSIPVD
ncbi:uncharacterized protein LOC128209975 [Mya arenaria]|uniref:uncharacterized protein LOC128209975 n=1 Tax=Mya arenaria TaxID=6604 RepID=UPI0022E667EB|nr:uncharacterized protein LOC128209975 [Mya arenaria]